MNNEEFLAVVLIIGLGVAVALIFGVGAAGLGLILELYRQSKKPDSFITQEMKRLESKGKNK